MLSWSLRPDSSGRTRRLFAGCRVMQHGLGVRGRVDARIHWAIHTAVLIRQSQLLHARMINDIHDLNEYPLWWSVKMIPGCARTSIQLLVCNSSRINATHIV